MGPDDGFTGQEEEEVNPGNVGQPTLANQMPPTPPIPQATIGRIVHYRLSESDVEEIKRRRTTSVSIAGRIASGSWPEGAQAHIGNSVQPGQYVPAIVVAKWVGTLVNLQCFLDGSDVYWALSREEGEKDGTWAWPPRV